MAGVDVFRSTFHISFVIFYIFYFSFAYATCWESHVAFLMTVSKDLASGGCKLEVQHTGPKGR